MTTKTVYDPSNYELVNESNEVLEPAIGDYGSRDYREAVRASLDASEPEGWVHSVRYGRVYAQRCA